MRQKGFSLIELLIVIAIIGILAAIAVPSYERYLTETRRSDGIAMLLQVIQQQERYYTEASTYTTNLSLLGYGSSLTPVDSGGGHYSISASTCASSIPLTECVLLTATPQGKQAGDGDITLNSRGARSPSSHWK